jgi:hypothetical protein
MDPIIFPNDPARMRLIGSNVPVVTKYPEKTRIISLGIGIIALSRTIKNMTPG